MAKVIVITSGKGGVGKTTTAINLGAAMNHFGKNVIVVDGNISTPNVGIHLGSPEVPVSLNHILQKKAEFFEGVYEHESGLKIMPASLSIQETAKTKIEKIKTIKDSLTNIADFVIVDSAAGLGAEAMSVVEMADELIIVTNPEMPAITDALKAIKMAEQRNKEVVGIIMTRVRKDKIELQPHTVKEMLEVDVLGMVPEDRTIAKSLNLKDAIVHTHPKSQPARAYKEIAAKITGDFYDSKADREKLLSKFLKKIKLKKD